MNKILLAALLLTAPAFADQTNTCAKLAISYSLMVEHAYAAKDREAYNAFIEYQIANQSGPPMTTADIVAFRKVSQEAWEERNSPPVRAAMDVFRQCRKLK